MRKYWLRHLLFALFGMVALPVLGQDGVGAARTNTSLPEASGIQEKTSGENSALVRIERFEITGNTLLDAALLERLLAPYKGDNRSYTDIQLALETLEGAYRNAGYSAVHVIIPEQEITGGTVTFKVVETVVDKVILKGSQYYDENNIRNALPALVEGSTPSALKLSENIRLANENPTRQIDVVLAMGDKENTVDAKVNVQDSSPRKVFVTLDNTGSSSTGMYRAGVGFQHNNLFNRDHAATFNYVTSPGHVNEVKQFSVSYRLPFYALGDSLDMIAARSDSNAGTSPVVGGFMLTFSGKGSVYGMHYNHYLPRSGDYTSRVVTGLDYRAYYNNCTLAGVACPGVPDLTLRPFSISYAGTQTKPSQITDFSASIVHNVSGGARGGAATFNLARAGAKAEYSLLRFNGSLAGALPQDWQYRLAGNFQFTYDALVSYESFGLAGANAVRGFTEREVSNDKGAVLNLELYTPELASQLHLEDSSFRLLGFVDRGRGWKVTLPGEAMTWDSIGSAGVGFRYTRGKNVTLKFDLARVTGVGGTLCGCVSTKVGNTRGELGLAANW